MLIPIGELLEDSCREHLNTPRGRLKECGGGRKAWRCLLRQNSKFEKIFVIGDTVKLLVTPSSFSFRHQAFSGTVCLLLAVLGIIWLSDLPEIFFGIFLKPSTPWNSHVLFVFKSIALFNLKCKFKSKNATIIYFILTDLCIFFDVIKVKVCLLLVLGSKTKKAWRLQK